MIFKNVSVHWGIDGGVKGSHVPKGTSQKFLRNKVFLLNILQFEKSLLITSIHLQGECLELLLIEDLSCASYCPSTLHTRWCYPVR